VGQWEIRSFLIAAKCFINLHFDICVLA
jgi:hypothetical protein